MKDEEDKEQVAALNLQYVSRTYCSACRDARTILQDILSSDFAKDKQMAYVHKGTLLVLKSLIEELQVYGSRMEAGLEDLDSYKKIREDYKEMKKQMREWDAEQEARGVKVIKRRNYLYD